MKKGFTLAEVLITLGIIGIVSAMTIPALIKNHQKKVLHTQFLKAYSEILQVTQQFSNQEEVSVHEYAKEKDLKLVLDKFMEYYINRSKQSKYSSTNEINGIDYKPQNLTGDLDMMVCDATGLVRETGGRIFMMDAVLTANSQIGPKLCIDINGSKRPNKYGYDWFVFIFTKENKVIPYIGKDMFGAAIDELENPAEKCSFAARNQSYSCGYYALSNTSPVNAAESYWEDFLK